MLLRIIILFLIAMAVMGMIQKALRPKDRRSALDRLRCPECKRVTLGSSPAPCARADCGNRR